MAHTLKITQTGSSIGGLLSSIGASIFSAMMRVAEANSRSKEIEFLRALSDEDPGQTRPDARPDRAARFCRPDGLLRQQAHSSEEALS